MQRNQIIMVRAKKTIGTIPTIRIIHRLPFPRKRAIFWSNKLKMEPAINRHTFYRQSTAIVLCQRWNVNQTQTIQQVSFYFFVGLRSAFALHSYQHIFVIFIHFNFRSDENVIGLSLQEILPDNNIKAEKMLVSNPPNILKRAKALKMENAVSEIASLSSIII